MEYSEARKLSVSETHCLDVILRKTASMMSLSCKLAALLSEANPEQEKALIQFGTQFGMAFQLMDDAMDYDSEEDRLGKPPGNDFKEGHVTLPLLHLYKNSDRSLKKEIEGFVESKISQKKISTMCWDTCAKPNLSSTPLTSLGTILNKQNHL